MGPLLLIYWRQALVGALALAALAVIAAQHHEVASLGRRVKDLEADEAVCEASVARLEAAVDAQNQAAKRLSAASANKAKASAAALAAARGKAKRYDDTEAALGRQQEDGDECDGMRRSLDVYLGGGR